MPRTRTYGLDADTIAYAARVKAGSGVIILPEPLKQLNKFIVGIKKLGLWDDMICWPMRSIHNAGTGSTLYSLGGGGTYNGTFINNTNWSYNGVTMSAVTSDNISLVNFPINDLINGLNLIAYFVPTGSSPALSNSANYFYITYPSASVFYSFGHSGTGGTTNVMSSFYSNDGQRYYTNIVGWSNTVRNQTVCYAVSNKKIIGVTPSVSITNFNNGSQAITRTSPNTLIFRPINGDAGCTLEFIVIINNFDTVANRQLIQDLYNKTLRTRQIYF